MQRHTRSSRGAASTAQKVSRYLLGDQAVRLSSFRPDFSIARDTGLLFTGKTSRAQDTFPSVFLYFYFALHGAGVLRKAFSWLSHLSSKDFCSSLVTVTDVYLQDRLKSPTSKREMDNSPGKIMFHINRFIMISMLIMTSQNWLTVVVYFIHFVATNQWGTTI